MRVRRARSEDCEVIGEGMKVVVDEGRWLATASAAAAELADLYRETIAEGHMVFVLEDGEEVVGALSMHPTRVEGVIGLGMWILPTRRGRGGGRMLMEAALAARPADAHKMELEVFPDNAAAIGLYRAMGFEEEGLRRDHYRRRDGSLRSALIMGRLFDAGPARHDRSA